MLKTKSIINMQKNHFNLIEKSFKIVQTISSL